jgi:hypothetical protein
MSDIYCNLIPLTAQVRIEPVNQLVAPVANDTSGRDTLIAGLFLGLALLSVIIGFVMWLRRDRRCADTKALFRELCSAHHLSRSQVRVLWELARVKKISDPTSLIIDSHLWIVQPSEEPSLCKPKVRNRISTIQRLLFETFEPNKKS